MIHWERIATKKENHRPISLMNTDEKNNNYLPAKSKRDPKEHPLLPSRYHSRDAEMVEHVTINQYNLPYKWTERNLKKIKNTIILLDKEKKSFDKNQYYLMIKDLERVGKQGTYLNIIKTICIKPVAMERNSKKFH